jgi:hypothetical protein
VELPGLTQVQGAFNMQTSEEFDCGKFEEARNNKVIKGDYECQGSQTKPGTAGTKPSSTSGGSGSSKTGAANPMDMNLPFVFGGSSLVAGILQILL